MKLMTYLQNANSEIAAYQQVYRDYVTTRKEHDDVTLDLSGIKEMPLLCAKELFGQLLIKNKYKDVLCTNVDQSLFFNISNGVKAYFEQEFPQGILSSYGAGTIISPQVEMDNNGNWHRIHLSDDVIGLI